MRAPAPPTSRPPHRAWAGHAFLALALAACATLADRQPPDRYELALTVAAETVTAYAAAERDRIDRLAPGPAREHAEAALTAVLDRYELAEAVAEAVLAAWQRGEASEADVAHALARVAAAVGEAGL